ncbi:hypothetical protein K1T71_012825 [Dendrolimus kikuchii]|uniref:Uncharacterized protein n=1 Tax=Dendrolimus kikuchii TaxID=765133 RepID=A0ACC1CI60_9NEOP|nr:hypothetical protein K1T71_012825 [Dendrolimus kikuchii]
MHCIEIDKFRYEIKENGDSEIVKSMESVQRAFIRFTNRTSRPVNVWWRNYQGKLQHYASLKPGAHYDVNTFLTHPWEFSDAATFESYVINNKPVFKVPNVVAGMRYRTNWNISIPVRSLRFTAMLAVASNFPDANKVVQLELPTALGEELFDLVQDVNNCQPAVPNK